MTDSAGLGGGLASAAGSALDRQTDALLQRVGKTPAKDNMIAGTEKTRAENAKIDKSARDFESILLGTWLQQAEQSFAKVPGGDGEEEDADAGKDQLQGIGVQSLAGALTASGGIGIAKMISAQLHRAAEQQAEPPAADGSEAAGKLPAARAASITDPSARSGK